MDAEGVSLATANFALKAQPRIWKKKKNGVNIAE